jgi:hypothetical protein
LSGGRASQGAVAICEALGQAAVEAGMTVAWFTIGSWRAGVVDAVAAHEGAEVLRLIRCDLIVIDDIGLLPVSPDAAEGFYRLVDAAYRVAPGRPDPGSAELTVRVTGHISLGSGVRRVDWIEEGYPDLDPPEIPPLAVVNEMLISPSGGGMNGGRRWTPFTIDEAEYQDLCTTSWVCTGLSRSMCQVG